MSLQEPLTKKELLTIAHHLGFTLVETQMQQEHCLPPVIYTHPDTSRFFNEAEILLHLNSDKFFVHLLNELSINFKWVSDATVECYAIIIETTVTSTYGYHDAALRTLLETTDLDEVAKIKFIEPSIPYRF